MPPDPQVYLKIGDVARRVGISPSAIRAWEKLGLTHPQRTESKYRLYTSDDVRLLKKARYLRKVRGLNAVAIAQMLKREGAIQHATHSGAPAIGPQLRRLRTQRGRSLAEVAAAAGISVGFLSALERSQMSASVGTLRRLARYYRTNILDFFDATEMNTRLVRPTKRKVLDAGPGVRMELLAWGNKVMEPHLFRIAPQAGSGESYTHEGEEFLFVLRGELQIALDGEEYHLSAATAFTSRAPRRITGKIPAAARPGCCGSTLRRLSEHPPKEELRSAVSSLLLLVQHNAEQRAMHLQSAVVVDEAELSEFVHEEIHPGAGGAHHFRQSFLTHVGVHGLRHGFFAEPGQYQKRSGQAFFAGIEELIDQVRLRAIVTFHHIRHKQVGQLVFLVERAQHSLLFNLQDGAIRNCGSGCQANGLIRGQASFAEEIAGTEERDGRFLALFGDHAQPNPPRLKVEHSVRALALRKNGLFRFIASDTPAHARVRQKGLRIEDLGLHLLGTARCRQPATRCHRRLLHPMRE